MGTVATGFNNAFPDSVNVSKATCRGLGATIEQYVAAPFTLNYNVTASPTSAPTGFIQRFIGRNADANQMVLVDSFGGVPGVWVRYANGTGAAPTAAQSGNVIGRFVASAYTGSAYAANPPALRAEAAQNFTATTQGMRWVFSTVPLGTSTPSDALWIMEDQSVLAKGPIGYKSATGAGGVVVQATSRSTAVTLNAVTGEITLAAVAGNGKFTLTNSRILANDTLAISLKNYTGAGSYYFSANCKSGAADIFVFNPTNNAEAAKIQFVVIRGSIN